MTYVFVFVGEFGYELLNWHAVVRKFQRLNPGVEVVCASRGQVAALYPGARYVDIGHVPRFRASVATGYGATLEGEEQLASDANAQFDRELRRDLRRAVLDGLRDQLGWKLLALRARRMRFVFSSSKTRVSDCTFGADPLLFGAVPAEGDIYDLLDLHNDLYFPVQADTTVRPALERRGMSFERPYVLVQSRRRAIRLRSTASVGERRLLDALAARTRVVVTEFATGRAQDSFSAPEAERGVERVTVGGFPEQSCLVHHAAACVFLTEGDFGSHIYVPPLLGRDVLAVAPRDVYELGTTPISFWNRHVFRFGGAIRPVAAEDLDSGEALDAFADDVARAVAG